MNKEAFEVLYGTLVRPQLKYAVHLWSPYQTGLREKLEQSEKSNKSYKKRLSTLIVMPLIDTQNIADMIMTYNILNHMIKIDARFMNTESRTRGHTKKLKISRSKIEITRNFFTNRITKRWNGLSQETINSKTIDAFKKDYDQEQALIRRCSATSYSLTAVN